MTTEPIVQPLARAASGGAALPRPRVVRLGTGTLPSPRLAVMVVVDSVGTGLFLAGSAVYLTRFVGLSPAQVGVGLSVSGGVGLLTMVPCGRLADRFGPRRVLAGISAWRAAGFAAYPLVQDMRGFLLVVCLLGIVDRAASPVTQDLVGTVTGPAERVRTMAVLRALRNVGLTAGVALAYLALAADTRVAVGTLFVGNAVSFLLVAGLVLGLPGSVDRVDPRPLGTPAARPALRDRPYVAVAALSAVLSSHLTLLGVALPLWVVSSTAAPTAVVAPLIALNTVLTVLLQVRVSRRAEGVRASARTLRTAGAALAACCVLLALAGTVPAPAAIAVLVAATAALTAGELLHSAGAWSLSYDLARPGQQGEYLSVFGLGISAQQVLGPVLVTGLVMSSGTTGWLALGAALTAAGIAVPGCARWAARTRDHRPGRAARHRATPSARRGGGGRHVRRHG